MQADEFSKLKRENGTRALEEILPISHKRDSIRGGFRTYNEPDGY